MNIVYRLLDSDNDLLLVEKLRCECFGIDEFNPNSSYLRNIKKKKAFALGAFLDNELVGAVYINDYYKSLYIDQIFVDKKLHRKKIATNMLKYVLDNKEMFEKIFNKKFTISRLESNKNDLFYEKMGYKKENNLIGTFKRRI